MIRAQFVHSNCWSEAREARCAKQTDNGAQTEPRDVEHRSGVTSHREETNRALDFKAEQDFGEPQGVYSSKVAFIATLISSCVLPAAAGALCALRLTRSQVLLIRASLGLLVTAVALMNALIIILFTSI
jgi:hypothetical protein